VKINYVTIMSLYDFYTVTYDGMRLSKTVRDRYSLRVCVICLHGELTISLRNSVNYIRDRDTSLQVCQLSRQLKQTRTPCGALMWHPR